MPLSSVPFAKALSGFRQLPVIPQSLAVSYLRTVLDKTRFTSHAVFLRTCLHRRVVPNGFQLKFNPSCGPSEHSPRKILMKASRSLMHSVLTTYDKRIASIDYRLHHLRSQLSSLCDKNTSHYIVTNTQRVNQELYATLKQTKTRKLFKLLPHPTKSAPAIDPPAPNPKLVVTIPTDLQLTEAQRQLLSRGLKFVPLQSQVNRSSMFFDCERYFRRLRLALFFKDTSLLSDLAPDPQELAGLFPRERSMWTPKPGQSATLDYYIDQCKHEISEVNPKPLSRSNISHSEQQALTELRQRKDIVIKQADKGGALVVWRKDLYEREALRQLSNTAHYTPMSKSSTKSDNALVRRTIKEAVSRDHLPPEATRAITKEPKESRFYMLPKIHKPDSPGRPIVSACACPTVHLSAFLDRLFRPLVEELPTYIKDTNHALELFRNFRFPDPLESPLLFTLDITSLYTNIPHKDGLIALKHFLSNSTFNIHVPTILRLTELVLTLNSFQFGDSHYQQTSGVAMGTRMGPSYACLFVGYMEFQIFQQHSGPLPALFRRFIDDCVGLWTGGRSELLSFISFVNAFHPSLKFTHEISDSSLPFLDIKLMITPDSQTISTSVHYKNTDSHSYLLFSSSHPDATKRAIPFSQFYRLRRLCCNEEDFDTQTAQMTNFFKARGYPEELTQQALDQAKRISREEALAPKTKEDHKDRTVLTLTHHPHNLEVKKILFKNFSILQTNPKVGETFKELPLMAFKRDRNLGDLLVRSSFQPTDPQKHRSLGNNCCDRKKCKCCPFLNTTTLAFKGPSGRQFTIRSRFTCQTSDLVYVVHCSLCGRKYVGETYRTLEERCKEHRDSIVQKKPTPVAVHFNTDPHNLSHFSISVVWRNSTGHSFKRKSMEKWIIHHLGTTAPDGLNIKD